MILETCLQKYRLHDIFVGALLAPVVVLVDLGRGALLAPVDVLAHLPAVVVGEEAAVLPHHVVALLHGVRAAHLESNGFKDSNNGTLCTSTQLLIIDPILKLINRRDQLDANRFIKNSPYDY